jgi:hypothetical protein
MNYKFFFGGELFCFILKFKIIHCTAFLIEIVMIENLKNSNLAFNWDKNNLK